MSLIKCSECGKEISDKAKECNGCGAPVDTLNDTNNTEINKLGKSIVDDKKGKIIFVIISILLIIGIPSIFATFLGTEDGTTIFIMITVIAISAICYFAKFNGNNAIVKKEKSSSAKAWKWVIMFVLIVFMGLGFTFYLWSNEDNNLNNKEKAPTNLTCTQTSSNSYGVNISVALDITFNEYGKIESYEETKKRIFPESVSTTDSLFALNEELTTCDGLNKFSFFSCKHNWSGNGKISTFITNLDYTKVAGTEETNYIFSKNNYPTVGSSYESVKSHYESLGGSCS